MIYPELVPGEYAATAAIRNYCGWHIAPVVTEVLTVNGSGSTSLVLPTLRIADITSVEEDGQVLDADAYEWSADGWLRKHCWTRRLRGVKVSLSHGYDDCPGEIEALIKSLAANSGVPVRAASVTIGPFSASGITEQGMAGPIAIGAYEAGILNKYRRPGLS